MKGKYSLGLGIMAGLLLTLNGCMSTTTSLPVQTSPTVVSDNAAVQLINGPAPSACRQLVTITSADVNGMTKAYATHTQLQENEIQDLKMQASKFGANTIIVIAHETSYLKRPGYKQVDSHLLKAIAFSCPAGSFQPSQVINLLPKHGEG